MVSIEPSFDMLDRHIKPERDFRYPPPPQAVFDVPADLAFQDPFAYDAAALCEPYGRSSPAAAPDERSNLSSGSAASSAVGSPQSGHGRLAPVPAWAAPQALNVSPDIVGHAEYLGAAEYGAFGMDEYAAFDFGGKPHGFVGELEAVSTRVPSYPLGAPGGQAPEAPVSPLSASSHEHGGGFVPFLSPSASPASHSPPLAAAAEWDLSPQTPRGFFPQGGNFAPMQSSCSSFLHHAVIPFS